MEVESQTYDLKILQSPITSTAPLSHTLKNHVPAVVITLLPRADFCLVLLQGLHPHYKNSRFSSMRLSRSSTALVDFGTRPLWHLWTNHIATREYSLSGVYEGISILLSNILPVHKAISHQIPFMKPTEYMPEANYMVSDMNSRLGPFRLCSTVIGNCTLYTWCPSRSIPLFIYAL